MIEKEKAWQIIKQQLPASRFEHTRGVVDTAIRLAEQYGAEREKAEIAAIFHDYAKYRPKEEMAEVIRREPLLNDDLLLYHEELWHAPVGAYLVKKEIGINDSSVLQAIASHTTGRAGMSRLEKVVFLADYIEPSRRFPGVDKVRRLAESSLDTATLEALARTIQFLAEKKAAIYPDTIDAYHDLLGQGKIKKG